MCRTISIIKLDFNDHVNKIMYTTTSPCLMCAKRIINAGVFRVVYLNEYRKTEGVEVLQKAGVEVWKHKGNLLVIQDRKDGEVRFDVGEKTV